jgi:protein TonB
MSRHGWRANLPKLIVGGVLLLVVTGMYFLIKNFIDSAEKPSKSKVQTISLVKPPPPKPPEEKPPEPVKPEVKDEVKIDQPQPQPVDESPPAGITSSLGPGDDGGFGLGAGDGKGTGRIGGGNGSRARWYAGLLANRIEQVLNRDSKLLDELKAKRIMVRVWVGNTGHVERVEWDAGTVPAKSEQVLRDQLLKLSLQESPEGVEQPIWYRFRPRG